MSGSSAATPGSTGPRTVEVNGETYEASKGVVLNPGTRPATPPIDGLADTPFWTNRDILRTDTLPASLAVIGGGPIGAELAQARGSLRRAGHRPRARAAHPRPGRAGGRGRGRRRLRPRGHPGADRHHHLAGLVRRRPVHRLAGGPGASPSTSCSSPPGASPTSTTSASRRSASTRPRARSRPTSGWSPRDGLWAIGDVVGHGAFTHMSMYQSAIAVASILGKDGPTADYRAVPHVTFTDPEVGGVGMTEKQARDAGPQRAGRHAPTSPRRPAAGSPRPRG